MSAEELAAMDAKIVADTIAEMQRQIEQLTGARHSMYDPAVAIARDIANRTPPAMSADHIGDAGNMVAPVEAVAWRFWHEGGWNFSLADPSPHLADCVERDALYTHPAPINPSGDTGELRERMKRAIWTQLPQEDANMGTSGRIADAILAALRPADTGANHD